MTKLKIYKTSSEKIVSEIIAKTIQDILTDGKDVLWLVSGGSAISVAVKTANLLSGTALEHLTASQVDERYGPVGHRDSNWQQLTDNGFRLPGATLKPILSGKNLEQTTSEFNESIKQSDGKYIIALLGLGADGHTAGILPDSPILNSKDYAANYNGTDYQRISLTPVGLGRLSQAMVYASGEIKRQALANLTKDLPIQQQPAQIIKRIPKVAVYNDLIGDEI